MARAAQTRGCVSWISNRSSAICSVTRAAPRPRTGPMDLSRWHLQSNRLKVDLFLLDRTIGARIGNRAASGDEGLRPAPDREQLGPRGQYVRFGRWCWGDTGDYYIVKFSNYCNKFSPSPGSCVAHARSSCWSRASPCRQISPFTRFYKLVLKVKPNFA